MASLAQQFTGLRCSPLSSSRFSKSKPFYSKRTHKPTLFPIVSAVAISNAQTKERAELKKLFEDAYERCRTTPLEGVPFTLDDFNAALEKYDFNAEIGTKVKGTVFKTDNNGALVDITAKSSAYLPVQEACIHKIKHVEDAGIVPGLKDEFVIIGENEVDDSLILSLRSIQYELAWERCRQLQTEDVVVKGKVVSANKGGVVAVVEGLRGFVPFSQISSKSTAEDLIERELPLKFVEVDEEQSRLVLSNRKAMADSQAQLGIGSVVIGTVQSLKPYGAFIDIGGINGLLHVSQISHDRVSDIATVLQPGDTLKVMILSHDRERGRVSLSQKHRSPDKWSGGRHFNSQLPKKKVITYSLNLLYRRSKVSMDSQELETEAEVEVEVEVGRTKRRRVASAVLRCTLGFVFPFILVLFALWLYVASSSSSTDSDDSTISLRSQCKIVSSSVDLRSSQVCELGLLNYKAKNVFYPFHTNKFRCRYDYYWASVFKVEYKDHSSGQMQLAFAEAPNEALPLNCRPNFGAAWLTKDKFKVNRTYDCWYQSGISKVSLYHDGFFSCQAKDPSTIEMIRRYSILSIKILQSSFSIRGGAKFWRWEMIAGVVTGFSTSLITISFLRLIHQMKLWLPYIWSPRVLPQAVNTVYLKRAGFFVIYFSVVIWLAKQYGKRLGIPEIFTALNS